MTPAVLELPQEHRVPLGGGDLGRPRLGGEIGPCGDLLAVLAIECLPDGAELGGGAGGRRRDPLLDGGHVPEPELPGQELDAPQPDRHRLGEDLGQDHDATVIAPVEEKLTVYVMSPFTSSDGAISVMRALKVYFCVPLVISSVA